MSADKASAETDPVREHLDKAENWLMLAEGNRGELIDLHESVITYGEEADAQRWFFSFMFESAKDLAEQHRALAQTLYDLTPQRIVTNAPDWAADAGAMAERLGEKLKADAEEFDAQTLRPGADPEPVAEGELWTAGDGWFWYAVSAIPAEEAAGLGARYVEKPRWLLAWHYAQVLRWQNEQRTKPLPCTWSEVGESLTDGDVCQTLRRPTAEERAAFYGPEPETSCDCGAFETAHVHATEPDPQPTIEELHERTTTIPPIRLGDFTNQQGTSLADLADKELENLINSVTDECARRQRENGTSWRSPGGAGQWNG